MVEPRDLYTVRRAIEQSFRRAAKSMGDTDLGHCARRAIRKPERTDSLVAIRSRSTLVFLVLVAASRRLELDQRDTADCSGVRYDCELCLDVRLRRFATRSGAVRWADGKGKYCEAATLYYYRPVFGFGGSIGNRQNNRCN